LPRGGCHPGSKWRGERRSLKSWLDQPPRGRIRQCLPLDLVDRLASPIIIEPLLLGQLVKLRLEFGILPAQPTHFALRLQGEQKPAGDHSSQEDDRPKNP